MKKNHNIFLSFFESVYGALTPDKSEEAAKSQRAYGTFREKAESQRRWYEVAADSITESFGTITFAVLHIVWFTLWILINTGQISGLEPFDPFPFGLLTMVVSLEAIFLSIFVLISQNRETQISDLREELDFQIDAHAEQEITKLIHMVDEIQDHLGIKKKNDKELEAMKKKLDPEKIITEIEKGANGTEKT